MDEGHEIYLNELPNYGVLITKVPDNILTRLTDSVNKIINSNFKDGQECNNILLGHMEHEYYLNEDREYLEPFLLKLAEVYNDRWDIMSSQDDQYYITPRNNLKLYNLWVNIQKKHEFNPPHVHSGTFSFALWLKIPYNLEDENKVFPPTSNDNPRTSKFTFHYNNTIGELRHFVLNVDKTFEGSIALFPSKLSHSVNPFYTSDDYRISIAGNLRLDV